MTTVSADIAAETPRALPRSTWRDVVFPVLIAVLLLTAVVAIAFAITGFAADPMAGT
jgi:hypothetical protein